MAVVRYWRSLRGRLSLVLFILFATIVLLGVASVWSLRNSNEVSNDVDVRWLPNTRLLGDLNNFTSDYRTAEADSLLATNQKEEAQALHDIQVLGQEVIRAQQGYERIPHDAREWELYRQFSTTWSAYRVLADQVTANSSAGRKAEAATLYQTRSRITYDTAQDLLGDLTDYNVKRAAQASERSERAYRQARWLLGAALVVAGLMLAAVVASVRRTVSGPLLELGQVMRRLAANDTVAEISHTQRHDEIGEMARAVVVFRSNAVDLVQSQRGLAQQATMLEEKLAHEQYVTQLQRNFVTMITHEFRTPLTQIDAHAQRLASLGERLRPADLEERTGRIRAAVQRIIRLIDGMVDTSRLMDSDAALFFHPEPMDLVAVLHDVCNVYRETSPNSQILENFDRQALPIIGDTKLLVQAFSNLLSNAIKYSPSGTRVVVRACKVDSAVAVTVEDRGIGIPKQDRERIFTRYYRGSNVSGYVGTGVGLFLVATVINLHSGELKVESEEGQGTCFTVVLPDRLAGQKAANA